MLRTSTSAPGKLRHGLERADPAQQERIVQLPVERVDVQEHALEVRIRADGLASLVAELRQWDERKVGIMETR
jgi:hypothetical protein